MCPQKIHLSSKDLEYTCRIHNVRTIRTSAQRRHPNSTILFMQNSDTTAFWLQCRQTSKNNIDFYSNQKLEHETFLDNVCVEQTKLYVFQA